MTIITCPSCGGSGDAPGTVDLPHAPPCDVCDGRGEIRTVALSDSVALVPVSHGGSTLTVGMIYEYMNMAKSFMDGWEALRDRLQIAMTPQPRYADVRDYLRGEFDAELIPAALVALYLTREEGEGYANFAAYWLRFHPAFYEAEV